MFIGYQRSGHSYIGALLDAHPNTAVGMEVDALNGVPGLHTLLESPFSKHKTGGCLDFKLVNTGSEKMVDSTLTVFVKTSPLLPGKQIFSNQQMVIGHVFIDIPDQKMPYQIAFEFSLGRGGNSNSVLAIAEVNFDEGMKCTPDEGNLLTA